MDGGKRKDKDVLSLKKGLKEVEQSETERRKTEEALQELEIKFSEFFNLGPNVFVISTIEDGRFVEINENGVEELGYSKEELLGNTSIELGIVNPEDRNKLLNLLESDGSYSGIELKVRTKKEKERFGLFYGRIIEIRGIQYLFQTIVDQSDFNRMEQELIESEQNFRNLFDKSPDGIFIVDFKGHFLQVNKTMCAAVGYREEELLEQNIWSLVPAAYKNLFKKRLITITKGQSPPEPAEYEVVGKDGTTFVIEVRSNPYKRKGKIIGFQGIARDITKRNRTEKELEMHRQHLEELVKERTKDLQKLNNELQEKNAELEIFYDAAVDREFRIKELRDRVDELEKKVAEND